MQVCPPSHVGPHHIGPHPRHQVGSYSSLELTQLPGNGDIVMEQIIG